MGLAVDRAVAHDLAALGDAAGVVERPPRAGGDQRVEVGHAPLLLPEEGVRGVEGSPPLGPRTPDHLVGAVDGEGGGYDVALIPGPTVERTEVGHGAGLP